MPKRTDVREILIIGSGPIQIGQAAGGFAPRPQASLRLTRGGLRPPPLDPPRGELRSPRPLGAPPSAAEVR